MAYNLGVLFGWFLILSLVGLVVGFIPAIIMYVVAANDHKESSVIKQRSVIFILLMSIITLGFYAMYWKAKFHMEVRTATGKGLSPIGNYLLLWFVPFYNLYWSYITSRRLSELDNNRSIDVQLNLGIILYPLRLSAGDRAILAMLTGGVFLLQAQANELPDSNHSKDMDTSAQS